MGTLYLVSTPIGNLDDLSIRAIKTLLSSESILCEDTRRTGMLIDEIRKRYAHSIVPDTPDRLPGLLRFDDHTENRETPQIINRLTNGAKISLVSDAGTPLLSDPGFYLVRECRKRHIPITAVPGPSALLTALTLSGKPMNRFRFFGYPPEKSTHRQQLLNDIKNYIDQTKIRDTVIFYCAPHKVQLLLEDMLLIFGNIDIVIARELTKVHEEIWTGPITSAIERKEACIGEIVLIM